MRRLIRIQADPICQIQSTLSYLFGTIPKYLERYQIIQNDTKVIWYERFSALPNPNLKIRSLSSSQITIAISQNHQNS